MSAPASRAALPRAIIASASSRSSAQVRPPGAFRFEPYAPATTATFTPDAVVRIAGSPTSACSR